MFASSSHCPLPAQKRAEPSASQFGEGEGRDCEVSRQVSAGLLVRNGRPTAWLLLLAGSCVYVVAQALVLRFA